MAAVTWIWRLLALLALVSVAQAQDAKPLKGVALVIGEQAYEKIAPLSNPGNDARDIAKLLTGLGFESRMVVDRDAKKLKRDLERFLEDAEGADVALVYYSGHAIEAGGENYLVPIDADMASLGNAQASLVALSEVRRQLEEVAPVVVLLLDACRTNPFAPNAQLKRDASAVPAPLGTSGLAVSRGMTAVSEGQSSDNIGIIVSYSAEPGRPALDGEKGSNSPYAGALIRHLSAISGASFGDVMTMVTEEVYLKTKRQQRPWVNASLRRLLYFGVTPEAADGEQAAIDGERRQLLLTVATLPPAGRKQVEAIADADGVPLDTVLGMLRVLGTDKIPNDPEELDRLFRAQTRDLKEMMERRRALATDDPEMQRLAEAADRAIKDGAIVTARGFLDRAVARVEQRESLLDDTEAQLKARRLDDAEIYARRAETANLAFDHLAAAQDFARAFGFAEKWDTALAWRYKRGEADALQSHGEDKGDNAVLERALAAYEESLKYAPRAERPEDWAKTKNDAGTALQALGARLGDGERLEAAMAAYREALEVRRKERAPIDWAKTQNNVGNVLLSLAAREEGTARLEEAVAAYRHALEVFRRETDPLLWATTQSNLAIALNNLGQRETGSERIAEAITIYRALLEVRTRAATPIMWAETQLNLGVALQELGARQSGTAGLEEAVAAYRLALAEFPRERVPLKWATTQSNLGTALRAIGERANDPKSLEAAIAAYRAVLDVVDRKRAPLDWADVQMNLGGALSTLADRGTGTATAEEAIKAFNMALEEATRERAPLRWASLQSNLGSAYITLGEREGSARRFHDAIAAYETALVVWTRDRVPKEWASGQMNLGNAYQRLAMIEDSTVNLERSIKSYRLALEEVTRARAPADWSMIQTNLGSALWMLGVRTMSEPRLQEAVVTYDLALEEQPRDREPFRWAQTQENRALALMSLSITRQGTAELDAAIAAFDGAIEEYRKAGAQYAIDKAEKTLAMARKWRADRGKQ